MNKFITDVLRSENFEELPVISLEDELSATLEAENIRHILSTELEDAARTVNICEALEGLAFVAQTVQTPTPQQAALIQIGGDLAMAGTEMTGEEITPSLEDAGETGPSTAAKVRAAIEQVIKVLRELLARVAAAVKKYVQHIRSAIGGHVQRQKQIEERLKEVRSKKQFSDKEFSFWFPMAEGKTIANLEELVRQSVRFTVVSESFLKQANEFNIGYASSLVQLYAQIGGEKSVVENFSKLNDVAKSSQRIGKSNSVEQFDLPNLDYFSMRRLESEQLIGGITIVTTQAMSLQEPEDMSSASFKQALDELTTHIGVKIKVAEGGWSKESFMTKPLTLAQLDTAVKVCSDLIEHYTGKSEHTSLAAATERRAEFAETSVEHITKYVDKFKKDDPSSRDFAMSAQRVGTSIITNASTPYTNMSSAMSRVISVLQSAIIKSLNAHESLETDPKKAKPSNESIADVVYSAESLSNIVKDFFNLFQQSSKTNTNPKNVLQDKKHSFEAAERYIKTTYLNDDWLDQQIFLTEPISVATNSYLETLAIDGKPSLDVFKDYQDLIKQLKLFNFKVVNAMGHFQTEYLKIIQKVSDIDTVDDVHDLDYEIGSMDCPLDAIYPAGPSRKTTLSGMTLNVYSRAYWYYNRYGFDLDYTSKGSLKPFTREEIKKAGNLLLDALVHIYHRKGSVFNQLENVKPEILVFEHSLDESRVSKSVVDAFDYSNIHVSAWKLSSHQNLLWDKIGWPYAHVLQRIVKAVDILINKSIK